jgi:hypothetical protein
MEASKIAVAGATRESRPSRRRRTRGRGEEVVPISRSSGVDMITGERLAEALAGVECVIDAATGPSAEQEPATAFFSTAAPL